MSQTGSTLLKARPRSAAPNIGGTHPSSRDSTATTCGGSLEAQATPGAAPNAGGTHTSSRDSTATTCAGSLEDATRELSAIQEKYPNRELSAATRPFGPAGEPPGTRGEDPASSIRAAALKGTAWTLGAFCAAAMLRLVSNIVLSRLLAPQYFGLMTLLSTVMMGLSLFSDLGLNANIIRSERGEQPLFLNTAWTMQVLRGIFLWMVCLCVSFPIAAFYGEPQLRVMIPAVGLSLVISGFNSTSLATLGRRMAVRELALMELTVQVGQILVTVAWALFQHSVWALVAGRLFSETLRLVLSHRLNPAGQRNHFVWDHRAASDLFAFGRWVLLSTALTFLASQSDRLILGKLVSLTTLGLYGFAFVLADIPRQIILSFCGRVAFPFVSRFSTLPRREFRELVAKYRWPVLAAAALLLSIVVNSGDLFLLHVYDKRYHEASWMVPVLALGLWHTLLYATSNPGLLAVGAPRYNALGYLLSGLALLALVPVSFHALGMAGAVWAIAFSDLPMYFVNLFGLWRENLMTLAQDLKATALFAGVCGSMFLLRMIFGLSFSHVTMLR